MSQTQGHGFIYMCAQILNICDGIKRSAWFAIGG